MSDNHDDPIAATPKTRAERAFHQVERALLRTLLPEGANPNFSQRPFSARESASQRISTEAALRPAFCVEPSAFRATVVHPSCEPLSDERTATENDNQKQKIGENLRQERSKSMTVHARNFHGPGV